MSGMCSFAADCQASLLHMSAVSTYRVCAIGLNPDIPDMASGHSPGESAPAIPRPDSRPLSGHTPPQPRTPGPSRARSAARARTAPAPYYYGPLGSTAPHADAQPALLHHRACDQQRAHQRVCTTYVTDTTRQSASAGSRVYGLCTAPGSLINGMPEAQDCTAARKPRTTRCYSAYGPAPSPYTPSRDVQSGTRSPRPHGLAPIAAQGRSAKKQKHKGIAARLSVGGGTP
jgi:hypothetical protein